ASPCRLCSRLRLLAARGPAGLKRRYVSDGSGSCSGRSRAEWVGIGADGDGYEVSTWEVAAVVGGVAGAVVVMLVVVRRARLVTAVASLDQATRELGRAVKELRAEAIPLGMAGTDGSAGSAVRS